MYSISIPAYNFKKKSQTPEYNRSSIVAKRRHIGFHRLHGGTLLFPFAPCRRMGQRAAVRNNLCFAAQLNTGFVSRLPCLSTGTGLVRRGGNGYCKREPRFLR